MKKLVLILGMFVALTFMSMNSIQAETSTWTVTHFCIHDANDVSLEEYDVTLGNMEPYVLTMVAKADEGDYGTISMDNAEQTKFELVEFASGRSGVTYKTFYFKGIDNQSVECILNVILYIEDGDYAFSLSATYPDKILYWAGVLIEFEEEGIET